MPSIYKKLLLTAEAHFGSKGYLFINVFGIIRVIDCLPASTELVKSVK